MISRRLTVIMGITALYLIAIACVGVEGNKGFCLQLLYMAALASCFTSPIKRWVFDPKHNRPEQL